MWRLIWLGLLIALPVKSGVFQFAGDERGADIVAHPAGYDGKGQMLVVTVGIVPSSLHAEEMVIPVQNVINTWNQLKPTVGNVKQAQIPTRAFDFESIALHELGHCIGLAHPNLATESGITDDNDKNFTKSTRGANNRFDLDAGADGVIGSGDDLRGDDVNLHWFAKVTNNPFILPDIIDKTTYSRDIDDLPPGDVYVANGDRLVSDLFGVSGTEAVMQQGIISGETRRTLAADDVATIRLAMSGLDMIAGTEDDYQLTLQYVGFTETADIVFDFDDESNFAACQIRGTFLQQNKNHIIINRARISFNSDFTWYFNDQVTMLPGIIDVDTEATVPVVHIKANGSSDQIALTHSSHLLLTIELNAGAKINEEKKVDYWVWAETPAGTYWLNNQLQFVRSDEPIRAFDGPLLNLPSFTILDGPVADLPSGSYEVFFAVDNNLDNIVDATFQDQVTFSINQ